MHEEVQERSARSTALPCCGYGCRFARELFIFKRPEVAEK